MKKASYISHLLSVLVVAFFIFIAFGSDDDKKTETTSTNNDSGSKKSVVDELTPGKLKELLEREIISFDKPFNGEEYKSDITSLQVELGLFGAWGNYINKGLASNDPEIKKLGEKLELKVVTLQKKEFPKMREAYIKILANKMWEYDMYIYSEGSANKIINLTAGVFAANKSIKQIQETLQEALTLYRFKEARYRWYKGEDEFTYYKIESPKDEELVTFDN